MSGPDSTMAGYGERARAAARLLASATTAQKAAALEAMAGALDAARSGIMAGNEEDCEQARREGVSGALLERQSLRLGRFDAMTAGLRKVAGLPDPVGVDTGGWRLYNGIRLQRTRVPLGVVAVIYEARPNVTADAAGLCVMSGNAALLRGSSFTLRTNLAIADALRAGMESAGLPRDSVQVIEDVSRRGARDLMTATAWVDLLVPRGGPGLVATVLEEATVPVVIDGAGNCHVYVDASADAEAAEAIVVNAKVQRPGVCNAAEKLLVHRDLAPTFLPRIVGVLRRHGVEVRGDDPARAFVPDLVPATGADWDQEYLDLVMAVRVVDGIEGALEHIARHGTGHTEAIVTGDHAAARRFVDGVDAAVTAVNASTRFTDGGEFGFGAEIGISTQKLHARGPMGLEALTTERYVLWGDGQVR